VNQDLVSFYFTNVPADISYKSLRQGFEVCGMMEDVYLARKRNVNGGVFGFVRYCKVKDVDKLLHALNNVWFGDWKVVAKVSSFDRDGINRKGVSNRVEGEKILEGEKSKIEEEKRVEGEKRKAFVGVKVREAGVWSDIVTGTQNHIEVQDKHMYVCKYRSDDIDVSWASKGLVMSVVNGEAIPVVQRRIFDAGFENLDIIPLGADKVLVRTSDNEDVSHVLSKATDFFDHFFSQPVKWNKEVSIRERGAWVRIYGVPLHAWNLNFFKLCVFDCGRLLRWMK
jgi:hypothetical protein